MWIRHWGFIAVESRSAEQRVVEYRLRTHTQSTAARRNCPLTSDHLPMFLQNVGTTPHTWRLFCAKSSRNTHLDFWLVSEAPGKTEEIASLCAERVQFL
ncbi:hypothetical protein AVEN_127025-1 [Araneus ventricosus]|uniref:Uncharacterized protein n=1 Tax=Araneus ventricosus TaxID=182803 RepID=A0A4Y2C3M5_ARAVE|nr:hypothetical protein AVEN_127025-1 [Araneus ventricosus]